MFIPGLTNLVHECSSSNTDPSVKIRRCLEYAND